MTWSDDGRTEALPSAVLGFGLLGMAERATLLGGTFSAGPAAEGGWLVEAVLPVKGGVVSIRVVVADGQDLVRTGLVLIFGAQPGIEVVGEARDGIEAVELATRLRPDVVLVDIGSRPRRRRGDRSPRRPGCGGPLAVVVITTFDLDEYVLGALRAGARGFLLKDAGPALLV